MSTVSSSSLFHFTKSLDIVISILEYGFFPRCAIEDYSFILTELDKEEAKIAIPMVCFCDLPEGLQADHKSKYGNYGIALKKEWGISKGICPVLYISDNAMSVNCYSHALSNCKGIVKEILCKKGTAECLKSYVEEMWGALIEFTGLMKIYCDNENIYYDEREWRYLIPFYDSHNRRNCIQRETNRLIGKNIQKTKLDKLNSAMEKEYALHFTVDDIDSIIVLNINDREALMAQIDENDFSQNIGKGHALQMKDKDLLKKKIRIISSAS